MPKKRSSRRPSCANLAPVVDELRTEARLSANQACEIVGISRSRYYAVKTPSEEEPVLSPAQRRKKAADQVLLERIRAICGYNNPRGNAETERMIRTIKEEVIWLEEFASFTEAKEKIGSWIEQDYNQEYPHSALGYRSPGEFEAMLHYQPKAA